MGKKHENIEKLERRASYCHHLEELDNNPKMQRRSNKLARKARELERKDRNRFDDDYSDEE